MILVSQVLLCLRQEEVPMFEKYGRYLYPEMESRRFPEMDVYIE